MGTISEENLCEGNAPGAGERYGVAVEGWTKGRVQDQRSESRVLAIERSPADVAKFSEGWRPMAWAMEEGAEKESVMERVVELLREIADVQGVALPSDRESLFDAGVLDSFGLLEFLTAIEKELDVTIPEEDLVPSNFDTITKIRSYLNGRIGG
jgi:D-alanine--poly(phosphoribitol) ligase subunit 2